MKMCKSLQQMTYEFKQNQLEKLMYSPQTKLDERTRGYACIQFVSFIRF